MNIRMDYAGLATGAGEKNIAIVRGPRAWVDGIVRKALDQTLRQSLGERRPAQVVDDVVRALEAGYTQDFLKLWQYFNKTGLDPTQRLLLSTPGIYASLIERALEEARGPANGHEPAGERELAHEADDDAGNGAGNGHGRRLSTADTSGLAAWMLRELERDGSIRHAFANALVDTALSNRGIGLADDLKAAAVDAVRRRQLPHDAVRVEGEVNAIIDDVRARGPMSLWIDQYLEKSGDLEPSRITGRVRAAMVDYLRPLPLNISADRIAEGKLDEFFSAAYAHAMRAGDGGSADPIDAVRQRGAIAEWDFSVDAFETIDEQGILRENILAAGALDYVHALGEGLGIFKLADAVVLRWASGQIDLQPGETPAKLYRYWKLRSERMQPEERAMLYRRVLNKGDGALLDGMVANESFPVLWGALMERVADYIARIEEKKTEEYSISRQPIYQAARQLQYNLTEFMTGMAHMQVTEMYRQLQEAKSILEDAQIVDFFGNGRRRSLWTVIERGHREWFGESPNIAAIRSLAVDGNRIFKFLADFDAGSVADGDFEEFRTAAEAWIIAQATVGGELGGVLVGAGAPAEAGAAPARDGFDNDWNL